MKKRIVKGAALTAATLCTAAFMTGCSLPERRVEHKTKTEVSFSWWGKDVRNEYTLEGLKAYQNSNQNVVIRPEYADFDGFKTRMDVEFFSDTTADVMQLNYNWLYEYSPDGDGFYDLNELSDYINLSAFDDDSLAYGTINGKLNALPTSTNCVTFYYNKTLYDSYGLSLPKNWSDLINAAEVMASDEVYPLAMSEKASYLSSVAYAEQVTGRKMFSDSGEFQYTLEDVRLMLGFYQEMLNKKVTKPAWDFDRNDFEKCLVGGVVSWISDAEYYCEPVQKLGFDIVIGDYPKHKKAVSSGWYKKPTSVYAIKKSSKSPEEAAKLLDYLVNGEEMALAQGTGKGVPASKAALEALAARDMLGGIEYKANEKMASSDELEIMSPKLENQDILELFISTSESLYYGRAEIENASENLYNKMVEMSK